MSPPPESQRSAIAWAAEQPDEPAAREPEAAPSHLEAVAVASAGPRESAVRPLPPSLSTPAAAERSDESEDSNCQAAAVDPEGLRESAVRS
mmetsp:Transcript_47706/g.107369  ORF Transcript_47706/g.107369 Transcript_47706/m.107369 type:complete len:91 (+) Transcript_47706:25-297(+)